MKFDTLFNQVIGCAIEVHRELGPGLLESIYEECLAHELKQKDIKCVTQKHLPVQYKGLLLECGYRIDLLIENRLIVELKCVESLQPIHEAQILTYMKMAKISTGLLINFNVKYLRHGIKRFVH
ncbi:MAG: GxxExxY protein [Gammaproteobacteria bacterium SG8_11]|nr:MAG: GxxExxY protein [Gammaproteobacteria bacterium SG8_11]